MKKTLSILLAMVMIFSFAACSNNAQEETETTEAVDNVTVNAYVISGPTGIGAVNMMKDSDNGSLDTDYNFTVVSSPDEVVSKISNGEADIAAVATNLAASLYNKTDGGVQIIAVNTLGVLYVLNNTGDEINSIEDLKGRTIYTTGQGANPEYIINYVLENNGIDPENDVTIEFKSEGSELVSVWATEPDAVIIAPQPVATSITTNYEGSVQCLDLTDEWEKIDDSSSLMMGCVVARTEFIEEHPQVIESFLEDYENSINAITDDLETTASLCEEYGIVSAAAIAQNAIPYCNICFITGDEMKEQLTGYLNVLYTADPTSIGGAMPDDDFWYV
ncbi:MAG: ABC transporter substrate-binding protein [Clostridiales bacterium]|nr:ABC transporter substrate-binding protein [Clostridiales bacterium]